MQRKVELHEAIEFWNWYAPRVDTRATGSKKTIHVCDITGEYDLHFNKFTGKLVNRKDVEFIPHTAIYYVPEYFYREWRDFKEKSLSDIMYGEGLDW